MKTLRLALRMMLRDLRAGELHLLGLAIIVAVASLTSVGFLADRVAHGLDREANQLLGGDLLLRSDHPWDNRLASEARDRGLAVTDTVLFTSMVSTADEAQLAGIKAIGEGYPLRGAMRVAPARNAPDALAEGIPARGELWLDERLTASLDVSVGDTVGLGELDFRVAAIVTFESDRGANFFSLLPRAIFNLADLDDTGLIVTGSRATWRLHVAGEPAAVDDFQAWVEPRLGRGEGLESIDNARPEVRSALDQAQRFLRLAALLAVILAAIAVGLSSRRFLRRHLDACAVMRCLGARQGRVLAIFVGEFVFFGLIASLVGVALGWSVQASLAGLLAGLLQISLPAPSMLPLAHGIAVGLALLVGFVLPQLLRLRRVSTLRVLRRELASVEPASGAAWLAGAAVLLGLVFWIAGDVRLGLFVALGFVVALVLFAFAAWCVLRLLGRVRGHGSLRGGGWRYGLASLNRRIGASVIQASALGLGIAALLLLTTIRADLLENWSQKTPPDAPNRFVVNIQPDQREAVAQHFADAGLDTPAILPMIRGRLVAINGEPVDPQGYASDRAQRLAEREFNLSYASEPGDGVEIVAGRWHGDAREPQWSVEEGLARTLGLSLGDTLRYEIGTRMVEAPITSLRALEWDSMRVNFFVVAAPGMLDGDPTSLVSAFHLPEEGAYEFTTGLVRAFPNLSVIDVAAVLAQVEAITAKLSLIVQFVFGFALLAGLIVLYAALQSTHDERDFELAVLRSLGARNAQLRQALLAEFAVLGGVAGSVAALAAGSIGWLLARFVFDMNYVPDPLGLVAAMLLAALGVVAGGWLGTRGMLNRPPLAGLRAVA
ncbi:ABC transporter permease [Pseudazoarcus pumilus]|uniref:ABC transporter permease n=1 Tax=Pseudazoarcus pumilus TaxID=2067960 RepID=A0A2I6S502_9RHOO|nr:FtsX-like permease family protein [Pseudazoarcus pumilus]AUN94340.1 ABC transporter permease [Pseudazoarcus pumilus]